MLWRLLLLNYSPPILQIHQQMLDQRVMVPKTQKVFFCLHTDQWPHLCLMKWPSQGGRNSIILGEALTNFEKKCHFFRHFYCLKSFHGPNLGEARASDFHQFRPPYLVNCLKICHIFGMLNPIIIFFLVNSLVYVEVDIVQGYSFGKNQVARNEKMHKPTGFPYTLTGLENFKHFSWTRYTQSDL